MRPKTDYERGQDAGMETAYRIVLAHLREKLSYKDTVEWLEGVLSGLKEGTVTTPSGETIKITEVELKPLGVQVEPPPTVGRIVHYYPLSPSLDGYGPFAAIITKVRPGSNAVALSILVPHDRVLYSANDAPYALTPTPGCWSWPPRT